MGNAASISSHVEINQTDVCEKCNEKESIDCKRCDKPACAECCPHKHNTLFEANPVPLKNTKITMAKEKHLKQIEAKCGVYTPQKALHVFGEAIFQDEFCTCCKMSSEWNLYNIDDIKSKPGKVTKRFHEYERSLKFPGDFCSSDKLSRTYFTLPCKKTVYAYKNHDSFDELFTTEGSCFGIACFAGGFAVSMEIKSNFSLASDWQVQVMNIKGELQRQIYSDSAGNPLFKKPLFLASNRKENVLFVSDYEKHSVIALDTNGKLLFEFTNDMLQKPLGLAVDGEQNVYVACGKFILLIEKDGKGARALLPVRDIDKAVDVCFEPVKNLLTVIFKSGSVTTVQMQTDRE